MFAAVEYSFQGVRRLWRETAFRHILLAFFPCLALLYGFDASVMEFFVFLILFLALIAVEALNTAIEVIIDRLTPNFEEFARDAKDLGSLATMCLLFANGAYLFALTLRFLEFF